MPSQDVVHIRMTGDDVHLHTVRSKEVATLLSAAETMLSELVMVRQGVAPEELNMSIVSLEENCVDMGFASAENDHMVDALHEVGDCLNSEVYEDLPEKTVEKLKTFRTYARRWNGAAEFLNGSPDSGVVARITKETKIELPEPPKIDGFTTIYGEVTRVGGAETKIWLDVPPGDRVICTANQDVARTAARRLYEWVGVRGLATWDAETWEMLAFDARELTPYEGGSIKEGFERISQIVGNAWDDVDPDEYVRQMRGRSQ